MYMSLTKEYPHLLFKEHWKICDQDFFVLGQCEALIQAIKKSPIQPDYYQKLLGVTLIKGAQATTAIEGNTLTFEEIEKVKRGEKLAPSKEYQEKEVNNILNAFTELFTEQVTSNETQLITPNLLLRLHRLVGKDLGHYFEAIPGKFREREVLVGQYRCPDHLDVLPLINKFCEWQKEHFKFEHGNQKFSDILIQAIVAHVYLELIHPFSDGNGRTGRLLEFYILLRGGLPNITLQILSNHYNLTRPEYYRQIGRVSTEKNISSFISYAITGFRDGLQATLQTIQESQTQLTWKNYIFDKFSELSGQKEVTKRKRTLALNFPLDGAYAIAEIPKLNVEVAYLYSSIPEKTLYRDLEELISLEILRKQDGKYSSNKSILNGHMPLYKGIKPLE